MFLRTVIRSVCLSARRRFTVAPPLRQELTSEPHKHINTAVNNSRSIHPLIYMPEADTISDSDTDDSSDSDTDDELEPEQDDNFAQEINFADVLPWAYSNIIGQMGQSSYRQLLLASMRKMNTSASILELQKMLKGGNSWAEVSVDFTVLVEGEPSKSDGSLNIKALKKGNPSLKDLKEEIWVVDPREKSWEPPKNVNIVNSETYGEMMKLCDLVTRDMPRARDMPSNIDLNKILIPVHQDDPPLFRDGNRDDTERTRREVCRNFNMVIPLRYAIMEEWPDQSGREGFKALLMMAQEVLLEQMCRAKIPPDYAVQFFVQNLGGSKGSKSVDTTFAYSQLEDDHVVYGLDLTTAETEGHSEILDEKLQEIRNSRRWLHTESLFKKKTYTPDGRIMVLKTPRNPSHGMREITITGLLTGEVKSSSEPVSPDANVFTSSCPYLRSAWTQSLIGLKYRNETATLFISPKLAVFMQIEAKDGNIVTHVKKYNIMNPSKGIPDQRGYQEVLTDLVQYLWNSYCSDFKN